MNRINTLFVAGAIGALTLQATAAPPNTDAKLEPAEIERGASGTQER